MDKGQLDAIRARARALAESAVAEGLAAAVTAAAVLGCAFQAASDLGVYVEYWDHCAAVCEGDVIRAAW